LNTRNILVERIADACPEFESVGLAQGYGVSLANVSGMESPRCDNCINWAEGDCEIFHAYTG